MRLISVATETTARIGAIHDNEDVTATATRFAATVTAVAALVTGVTAGVTVVAVIVTGVTASVTAVAVAVTAAAVSVTVGTLTVTSVVETVTGVMASVTAVAATVTAAAVSMTRVTVTVTSRGGGGKRDSGLRGATTGDRWEEPGSGGRAVRPRPLGVPGSAQSDDRAARYRPTWTSAPPPAARLTSARLCGERASPSTRWSAKATCGR